MVEAAFRRIETVALRGPMVIKSYGAINTILSFMRPVE